MKKLKGKMFVLLAATIIVLCAGFFIVGCGSGPTSKAINTILGNFSLDFTDCPVAGQCLVAFETPGFTMGLFEGQPLTFEAWVKPRTTVDGLILHRLEQSRGAVLSIDNVNASEVKPKFTIKRTVLSASGVGTPPTSTATYEVSAITNIFIDVWTHVAGVLVHNEDAAATANHVAYHADRGVTNCTTTPGNGTIPADGDGMSENDTWHIDIYVDGELDNCTYTYGGLTAHNDPDPTTANIAYAHEPTAHTSAPGKFQGLIDEARVWNIERSRDEMRNCRSFELAIDSQEECDKTIDSANLITYHTFNAGAGHFVYDRAGLLGTGAKEYPDAHEPGGFAEWNTGWSTDTPF
jgi:hypothetical protein